jgi:hypothetical protein
MTSKAVWLGLAGIYGGTYGLAPPSTEPLHSPTMAEVGTTASAHTVNVITSFIPNTMSDGHFRIDQEIRKPAGQYDKSSPGDVVAPSYDSAI